MPDPASVFGSPPPGEGSADPLSVLAELSRDFADSLDLDRTIEKALDLITRQVGAEGGALFLLDETGRELYCHSSVGPARIKGMRIGADRGILGRSVRENESQLVRDVSADPDFHGAVDRESGFVTHSILCAPLSARSDPIGAISLVNKIGRDARFDDRDRQLLNTLAPSVALAIMNGRMAAQLVGQERVRRELELAAEIQRNLLPDARPDLPVVGANVPAREVSGDFYDFFELPDGRVAFAVGDVSGKGMNAALLMAKTSSVFRALGRRVPEPGKLLALLNAELVETATRGMFVTMVAGLYDRRTDTVRLANAGHEPPLYRSAAGEWREVPAAAPPLGILPQLAPGDVVEESTILLGDGALYVFTDGVTEARGERGAHLGVEGFRKLAADAAGLPAREQLERILEHVGGLDARDDLTVLVVETRGPAPSAAAALPGLDLTMASRPAELKHVRERVFEAARSLGCGESCADELVMAVDEACQNVIRHGYRGDPDGEIVLCVRREGDSVVATLRDFAPPVDPKRVKPRQIDDLRPGGLGTHIMREVMDEVELGRPPSGPGNLLRMKRKVS